MPIFLWILTIMFIIGPLIYGHILSWQAHWVIGLITLITEGPAFVFGWAGIFGIDLPQKIAAALGI